MGPSRAILITRPEPGASETARRLVALGWRPVIAPMLAVRPRSVRLPDAGAVQAVLVTSAAAIPALPPALHRLSLFAVGDATALAARAAGFATVASAAGDARDLAALVAARCDPGHAPLLLASAARQGHDLARDLRGRGFRVLRRTVYDAHPVATLPDAARAALAGGGLAAVLVFSPATARALVRAVRAAGLADAVGALDAIAISSQTAAPLSPLKWRRIRVASRPNQDELLVLLP